jgi:hypothetical protein
MEFTQARAFVRRFGAWHNGLEPSACASAIAIWPMMN